MVTETLSVALNSDLGGNVVTSNDLGSTLEQIRKAGSFDVVLLDVNMPGMDGLKGVRDVVEANKSGGVTLFSGNVSRDFVWQAFELGVKGYVPKSQSFRSLASIIHLIASGEQYIPMAFSRQAADDEPDNAMGLNTREKNILKSAACGKTNKEIARELSVSEVTIKMCMRTIYNKLNARNRAHATTIAIGLGIIEV